jgi:hypothetical protein
MGTKQSETLQGIPQNRKDQLLGVCTARISLARLLYRLTTAKTSQVEELQGVHAIYYQSRNERCSSSPQNHGRVDRRPARFVFVLRFAKAKPGV